MRRKVNLLYAAIATVILFVASQTNAAQNNNKTPELSYTISFPEPHTHLYTVKFTIKNITTDKIDLQIPNWIPGSYMIRDYAGNIQSFSVKDARGSSLKWNKTTKSNWNIQTGASPENPISITAEYQSYANDLSVRGNHLDGTHAFFNGAALLMYLKGGLNLPHKVNFDIPKGYKVTSPLALKPDADGFYTAPNYDVLADSPTEIGTNKLLEFNVLNKPHRIAIWGEADFDEKKVVEDVSAIITEAAKIFGGLPYEHYTFFAHTVPGAGGGIEHLNSTTIGFSPTFFKSRRSYTGFLGLVAHEYFHLWNVKRIRPVQLGPFDYQNENYTDNLWVSEGFTSYYSPQILLRAKLISLQEYLEQFSTQIQLYESAPGRFVQSAAEASNDAWVKYYKPNENSINSTMSYYTKGSFIGALADLEIRSRTNKTKSLDDVMRLLLAEYGLPKPGFINEQLKAAFETVAGGDMTEFFNKYVYGTADVDFNAALNKAGLQITRAYAPDTLPEAAYKGAPEKKPGEIGIVRPTMEGDKITITSVVEGTPAYKAGIYAGDQIIAINGMRVTPATIPNVLKNITAGQKVNFTLFRRDELLNITVTAETKPFNKYSISAIPNANAEQISLRDAWLKN